MFIERVNEFNDFNAQFENSCKQKLLLKYQMFLNEKILMKMEIFLIFIQKVLEVQMLVNIIVH